MKIHADARRTPEIDFNDIEIGQLLIFPDNPGWHDGVFMRCYENKDFGKKNRELEQITMVRLDDGSSDDCSRKAGHTYHLTRRMIIGKVNTRDRNPFRPVPIDATLHLEYE